MTIPIKMMEFDSRDFTPLKKVSIDQFNPFQEKTDEKDEKTATLRQFWYMDEALTKDVLANRELRNIQRRNLLTLHPVDQSKEDRDEETRWYKEEELRKKWWKKDEGEK